MTSDVDAHQLQEHILDFVRKIERIVPPISPIAKKTAIEMYCRCLVGTRREWSHASDALRYGGGMI